MSKKIMGVTVGTPIRPSKFASELADRVEEMVKANTEQEKTVDITENGTVEIVPDEGYKLTKVTANVNVPTASGENKLAQFVEGTTPFEVTADDLQGITKIRDYAFYDCPQLEAITLPDTITEIGTSAFYGNLYTKAPQITNLVFPNSITTLGKAVCYYCSRLKSITLPQNAEFTIIPESAFHGCTALDHVVIPDNVVQIGAKAFQYCEKLTDITIGNGVTTIWSAAFYYCKAIGSITIPNSVTSIDNMAFYGCSNLTSVRIGNGITSMTNNVFNMSNKLTDIYIDKPEGSISGAPWGATNAQIHWNTPLPSEEG